MNLVRILSLLIRIRKRSDKTFSFSALLRSRYIKETGGNVKATEVWLRFSFSG